MRILYLPLVMEGSGTNERISLLSRGNELIGLRKKPTLQNSDLAKVIKYILFAIKSLQYGLTHAKEYDFIFCQYSTYALIGMSIYVMTRKPYIFEADDTIRYSRVWNKSKIHIYLLILLDRIVFKFAKRIIVPGEAVRQAFIARGFEPTKIEVIPFTPSHPPIGDKLDEDKETARHCLGMEKQVRILTFVGNMTHHPPNEEAAHWICAELSKEIAQKFNDVRIIMIGPHDMTSITPNFVSFVGFVPHELLDQYMNATDIFIAPVWDGVGAPLKVIDALSFGLPVIIPSWVIDYIPELVDGDNAIVAKDQVEFIEKTVYYLEHLNEAKEIGRRAHKMMIACYGRELWEDKLNQFLKSSLLKK